MTSNTDAAQTTAEQVRRHYIEHNISGEMDGETLAADIIADQLRILPEEAWESVLTRAIRFAHEEIHGDNTAAGVYLLVEGLIYPNGRTYTVTIAGPERHDGEAPWLWVVTAEDPAQAALKAAAIHSREQDVDARELMVIEVADGMPGPGSGAYNDRRDK